MLGGLLSGGLSLLGGLLGSKASKSASSSQLQAGRESNALQKYIYDQQREDFAPWRAAGENALGQMQGLVQDPSSIANTPAYQFRFDQGMNALQRSAPMQGGLYSGRAGKALERYGQGVAASEMDSAYNRLASLAGLGQTATRDVAAAGGQYGAQVGNTLQNMGNARAAGTIGSANAWTNALQQFMQQQNPYGWNPQSYPGGLDDFYGGFGTSGD